MVQLKGNGFASSLSIFTVWWMLAETHGTRCWLCPIMHVGMVGARATLSECRGCVE